MKKPLGIPQGHSPRNTKGNWILVLSAVMAVALVGLSVDRHQGSAPTKTSHHAKEPASLHINHIHSERAGSNTGRLHSGEIVDVSLGRDSSTARKIRAILELNDSDAWEAFCTNDLSGIILNDPLDVVAAADTLPPGYQREELMRLVSQGWGSRDPYAAMDWAFGLKDIDDRASAMANVSIAMSQSDPAAALVAAREYGVTDNGGLYQNMVAMWAARDPAGAYAWVSELPAGPDRDTMMARVAFAAVKTSPTDAAILATSEISDGPARDDAVVAVLHQWGMRDLASASAWASQLADQTLRERVDLELGGLKDLAGP
jgi:hypothetical protein